MLENFLSEHLYTVYISLDNGFKIEINSLTLILI